MSVRGLAGEKGLDPDNDPLSHCKRPMIIDACKSLSKATRRSRGRSSYPVFFMHLSLS